MKRDGELKKVSNNLQKVFGSRNWHLLWQTYTLVEKWPDLVGEKIASKSEPAYINKNVLWVYVHDSVWMQHLNTQKTELLKQIRSFNKDWFIEDIRWLLQPEIHVGKKSIEKKVGHKKEIDPFEQKEFEKISASIKNEQCRDALNRFWLLHHKNR